MSNSCKIVVPKARAADTSKIKLIEKYHCLKQWNYSPFESIQFAKWNILFMSLMFKNEIQKIWMVCWIRHCYDMIWYDLIAVNRG